MNVLISSAGRRSSLVKAFVAATHARGGRTWAGDMDGLAPALYLADEAVRLPRCTEPAYIETLRDLVQRHQLRLIVPTIDTELPALAAHADEFRALGCRILISTPDFVRISGDKSLTQEAFAAAGLDVPRGWTGEELADGWPDDLSEQLFVKPRDGSASLHTHAATRATLADVLAVVPHAIVQERLSGPEITIDALLDFDGRPLHCVPRRRVRTLGGESIQGETLDDAPLRPWLDRVLAVAGELGARGPITLQAFLTARGPVLIECNPRFGGGFPLAHAAGGRYPEWLLDLVDGRRPPATPGDYERGLFMTRYYVEHFTTQPLW